MQIVCRFAASLSIKIPVIYRFIISWICYFILCIGLSVVISLAICIHKIANVWYILHNPENMGGIIQSKQQQDNVVF